MIKITVITVCYNEKERLKRTVESVCNQTYAHIEYLIIDGASTDGTHDLFQEYLSFPYIQFYSEKDYGIYNAMNRGIARASGDYVYFLNAGDTFCNPSVIADVASYIENDPKEFIYYGNIYLLFTDGIRRIQDYSKDKGTLKEKLFKGYMPCHQAIFAPRKSLVNHYFREEYKIRADYEWLLYSVAKGYECKGIPVLISSYDMSGMSSNIKNSGLFQQEEQKILKEYIEIFTERDKLLREEENVNRRDSELKYSYLFRLISQWLALKQKNLSIGTYLQKEGYKHLAIYGLGSLGQRLLDELKENELEIDYVVDRDAESICTDRRIVSPDGVLEETDVMIITAVVNFNEIKEKLCGKVSFPILSLEEVINKVSAF